jgi:hypothetical protein
MVTGSGQSDTAATGFVVRVITAAGWTASTAGVRARRVRRDAHRELSGYAKSQDAGRPF